MKVISLDLNGNPIDWTKTLLSEEVAIKCLEIMREEESLCKTNYKS